MLDATVRYLGFLGELDEVVTYLGLLGELDEVVTYLGLLGALDELVTYLGLLGELDEVVTYLGFLGELDEVALVLLDGVDERGNGADLFDRAVLRMRRRFFARLTRRFIVNSLVLPRLKQQLVDFNLGSPCCTGHR